MNGRKPNKAEEAYIRGAMQSVGCVACNILGYENDYPEPEQYLSTHHNPDKGSKDQYCHFFSVPLCPGHHQGVNVPPGKEPVRHRNYTHFQEKVGSDLDMARFCWERLSLDTQDAIGEKTEIWSFEDLVKKDAEMRGQAQN